MAARSNLYIWQDTEKGDCVIQEAVNYIRKQDMNSFMLEKYQVFLEAARETRGQVLKQNGEVKEIPYHTLSGGKTRDGKEILGEEYSYLPSVDTSMDIESPEYVKGCYFSKKELEDKIKNKYSGFSLDEDMTVEIKDTDSADYVMEIQMGNQEFQGEEVRELLDLPSSLFYRPGSGWRNTVFMHGPGSWLGLSQYTVQQMSLEGKKYEEILSYFFPELTVEALN